MRYSATRLAVSVTRARGTPSLHSGCCTVVAAQWLLHSGCRTVVAAQWLLHSGCCTVVAAQWLLHSGCYTQWLLHSGFCTVVGVAQSLKIYGLARKCSGTGHAHTGNRLLHTTFAYAATREHEYARTRTNGTREHGPFESTQMQIRIDVQWRTKQKISLNHFVGPRGPGK